MLEWILGEWYVAVDCHMCGLQFAFASAKDPRLECRIQLTCIDCRQTDQYCSTEFVRVEAK
jgi:hypothetical protein